jgi:hypothetical protein
VSRSEAGAVSELLNLEHRRLPNKDIFSGFPSTIAGIPNCSPKYQVCIGAALPCAPAPRECAKSVLGIIQRDRKAPHQSFFIIRFAQKSNRSIFDGPLPRSLFVGPSHENDGGVIPVSAQQPLQVEAGEAGHLYVCDYALGFGDTTGLQEVFGRWERANHVSQRLN